MLHYLILSVLHPGSLVASLTSASVHLGEKTSTDADVAPSFKLSALSPLLSVALVSSE